MTEFLTALALVLVIEGLVWAVFPDQIRRALGRLAELPPEILRGGGLAAAALGTFCVWLLRG
ncbi:MAG: DUF2065 domain-containing protein [Kiloniellales bacterium]|nr:DUF2065 domain-containing protein [Kiloniellales bacterium]